MNQRDQRDSSARANRSNHRPTWWSLVLCVPVTIAFFSFVSPRAVAGPAPYQIAVGEVEILPGDSEVRIPVVITNDQSLTAWSTSITYDANYIELIGVDLTDTASAGLAPTIDLAPTPGPYVGVRVEYDPQNPLPAASSQRVAWLVFSVSSAMLPPGSGSIELDVLLDGPGIETFPLLFELHNGTTQVPSAQSTTITFYFGTVLRVLPAVGSYLHNADDPIRLEFRLWSDEPASELRVSMGGTVIVEPWLNRTPDLEDTVLEGIGGATVTVETVGTNLEIVISFPTPLIPATADDPILFLEVAPTDPYHGVVPLQLDVDGCELDGVPIENLLSSELLLEDVFVRGDVDFNGQFEMVDIMDLFAWLLSSEPIPVCADAADVNDDGDHQIDDAIFALLALFGPGSPPPPPPPGEPGGLDPTSDTISCMMALP